MQLWRIWIWFLALPWLVHSGVIPHNLHLSSKKSNSVVKYDDGYIVAPGVIDLRNLLFTTTSALTNYSSLDNVTRIQNYMQEDTIRHLKNNSWKIDEIQISLMNRTKKYDEELTTITIAIFRVPDKCSNARQGCDWSSLGVGKRNDAGKMIWCCTREASRLGLCSKKPGKFGGLIVDKENFQGHIVTVDVSSRFKSSLTSDGIFYATISGIYVVVYSNCNSSEKEVHITGYTSWNSKHGYLPGELYKFMIFYRIVTCFYFALLAWYCYLMRLNKDSRIEIERWIRTTIVLGLLEMFFRSGDYLVWNIGGSRSILFVCLGILLGSVKQGISRCLLIMVSMGWGVTRDTLGNSMSAIVVFGVAFVGTTAVIDSMVVFATSNGIVFLSWIESEFVSTVVWLVALIRILDVIFVVWVFISLRTTISHLTRLNQSRKLSRICHLRNLVLVSVLFCCLWFMYSVSSTHTQGGIHEKSHAWSSEISSEVNFLFVLIGIAILWRPNANARRYVYLSDLPIPKSKQKNNDLGFGITFTQKTLVL